MFRTFKNLAGKTFGRWTAISVAPRVGRITYWSCLCECGVISEVQGSALTAGFSQSCGCLCRERVSKAKRTHGMFGTVEYQTWGRIKARCYDDSRPSWKDYGGRGIKMSDEWRESFEAFYRDMGNRPAGPYSIDRKDVNGNYCKENCRWATQKDQQNNRRNNIRVPLNGKFLPINAASIETGVPSPLIYERTRHGRPPEMLYSPKQTWLRKGHQIAPISQPAQPVQG